MFRQCHPNHFTAGLVQRHALHSQDLVFRFLPELSITSRRAHGLLHDGQCEQDPQYNRIHRARELLLRALDVCFALPISGEPLCFCILEAKAIGVGADQYEASKKLAHNPRHCSLHLHSTVLWIAPLVQLKHHSRRNGLIFLLDFGSHLSVFNATHPQVFEASAKYGYLFQLMEHPHIRHILVRPSHEQLPLANSWVDLEVG